jgi:predicted MFS family arabinose efflux permease
VSQLAEGIRYALRTRDICLPIILFATLGSFGFNFNVFLPLVTRYVLERGPFELGILFSCLGGGSVIAALGLASRRNAGERTLLLGATAFTGLLTLLPLSPWLPVTMVLLLLLGGASIVFSATATTRMQLAAPSDLRGRVMSLHTLLFIGTTSVGSFTIGTLSEHFGVQAAMLASAGLCALGVVLAVLYARRPLPQAGSGPGQAVAQHQVSADRASV